jgi:tetratricopeptide (TPR) repeat protein
MSLLFREMSSVMNWKLSSLIVLFSCLTTAAPVRSQAAHRGLSLILVPTESEAVQLRSQIQSGASFEVIAVTRSSDPTAARSGYLGLVNESTLSREFQAALKGLQPGSVSPVTQIAGGFALLKVTTAEEDRWRTQHDDAVMALQQGRYSEATSLFLIAVQQAERFGTQDIRLAESLNGLSQVYRYQQNHAEAEPRARQSLAILEHALGPLHPGVIPSLVNLAGITGATGRYAEAERVYRRILFVRWGLPGAAVGADQVLENFAEVLSLDLTRDPGFKNAVEEYSRSLSNSRLKRDLYLKMRDGFIAAQLMVEAESLMQRAVNVYSDSRELQFQLGELYAIWGKYQKAIDAFESAARRGASVDAERERQQRSVIYERIGEMNFNLIRFDEVVAALAKALEINPASWSAHLMLGSVYLRRSRFDDATAEYSRVMSANLRNAAAHEGLARVALELERYTEAATDAGRALAIDPGLQNARYIKAMALIRGGDEVEGRAVLQDYQQRESNLQAEASQLAAIAELDKTSLTMLFEGRPQEAMALLRDGILTYPHNARLHMKLGLIQSRQRLHGEAAETFETMIRLQMDDFLVHRQLAREYEQLGKREAGQQQRVLYLQRYDAALQTKGRGGTGQ